MMKASHFKATNYCYFTQKITEMKTAGIPNSLTRSIMVISMLKSRP